MKHEIILRQLLAEAESNPNTLGFLVFGSVATGTYTEQSDIDTLTVLRKSKPSSGIKKYLSTASKLETCFSLKKS